MQKVENELTFEELKILREVAMDCVEMEQQMGKVCFLTQPGFQTNQ